MNNIEVVNGVKAISEPAVTGVLEAMSERQRLTTSVKMQKQETIVRGIECLTGIVTTGINTAAQIKSNQLELEKIKLQSKDFRSKLKADCKNNKVKGKVVQAAIDKLSEIALSGATPEQIRQASESMKYLMEDLMAKEEYNMTEILQKAVDTIKGAILDADAKAAVLDEERRQLKKEYKDKRKKLKKQTKRYEDLTLVKTKLFDNVDKMILAGTSSEVLKQYIENEKKHLQEDPVHEEHS